MRNTRVAAPSSDKIPNTKPAIVLINELPPERTNSRLESEPPIPPCCERYEELELDESRLFTPRVFMVGELPKTLSKLLTPSVLRIGLPFWVAVVLPKIC